MDRFRGGAKLRSRAALAETGWGEEGKRRSGGEGGGIKGRRHKGGETLLLAGGSP